MSWHLLPFWLLQMLRFSASDPFPQHLHFLFSQGGAAENNALFKASDD